MKIIDKIWLLVAVFALCACGNEETISGSEEPVKELKEYTVSLKLSGEITTSDSPLARAETESNDLYGVQVYRKKIGEDSYSYFANGLFDNVDDMKINLLEESTYKFEVVLVKKGKELIYEPEDQYSSPFNRNNNSNMDTNVFYYNSSYRYNALNVGQMKVNRNTTVKYPEADWYYGEFSNYSPTINGTVEINLKHTVFGLQYQVTGITDGTVSVTITNSERTFFTNSSITENYTSEEKIIAFYDAYNAWLYADNYAENITVSLSWTRGVGVVQNLGSKTIQVKRNVMNVVRIQLGANDGNASFGITTEDDTNMSGEEVTIPLG